MRIYPAVHYCMGGLWVDYELMSNVPGLFVLGEANFSDHGANRLGASALMQGLADGYFIVPYTMGNYLASNSAAPSETKVSADRPECKQAGGGRRPAEATPGGQRQAERAVVPPRAGQGDVGRRGHGAGRRPA